MKFGLAFLSAYCCFSVFVNAGFVDPRLLGSEARLGACRENYKLMHSLYNTVGISGRVRDGYAPPVENLSFVESPAFMKLASKSEIFVSESKEYTAEELVRAAIESCVQREPVNISMHHFGGGFCYDRKLFLDSVGHLGWKNSFYADFFDRCNGNKIAPNIAVYCLAPVVGNENLLVNIINVVGVGLDDTDQPDYNYFFGQNLDRRSELMSLMVSVFDKIFCCSCKKKKIVALSAFGCGAFAERYPGDFKEDFYVPALRISLDKWSERLKALDIYGDNKARIDTIGSSDTGVTLSNVLAEFGFESEALGRVPGAFDDVHLFVNAWDPHSMVGNGNKGDCSLDGFIGRSVVFACLCWGFSNPALLQQDSVTIVA